MFRRGFFLCILAAMAPACLGCRDSEHADLEKVKAELAEARAELKVLKAEQQQGYLDELERLAALRTKGVLTQEEFESKKKAALGGRPKQGPPPSPMDELAKQLRTTQMLFSNNTITNVERDNRKRQLIAGPLSLTDLKKDLETVQTLFGENVITNVERDTLKKRLLEMDSIKK
jgi:hypothetical protein